MKHVELYGCDKSKEANLCWHMRVLQCAHIFGKSTTHETFCDSKYFKNLEIIGNGGKQNISLHSPNCCLKISIPFEFSS